MLRQEFRVRRFRSDGELSHRFYKILYTAALRLGVVLHSPDDIIELKLEGAPSTSTQPHRQNREAWEGTLEVRDNQSNGAWQPFQDITAILERNAKGSYNLITFWPNSQNPDARDSYTDPLVDIAMSQDVPDLFLEYVANVMHLEFANNPGMSPAVAVQELNQELVSAIQNSANLEIERWKATTIRALDAQKEALAIADAYRDEAEKYREESKNYQALLEQAVLKQRSDNDILNSSPVAAMAVTPKWRSLTGSMYMNVGIKAHIVDVTKVDNKIELRYVDQAGKEKAISDFGRNGFVSKIYDYLFSRKGMAAIFIVTAKPGGNVMLASDTMMLDKYKRLWSTL